MFSNVVKRILVLPALPIASTNSTLDLKTPSLSPQKTHIGMSLYFSASFRLPLPQIGTTAAKRLGLAAAIRHEPEPPILNPVT